MHTAHCAGITFGTGDQLLLALDVKSSDETSGRDESLQHDAAAAVK